MESEEVRAQIYECLLPDVEATRALGARLTDHMSGGMVLTLSGDLGAGKTTLVRGMLRHLGFTGAVKSPSYALVEEYPFSRLYFYHFDFYRFRDPEEWETTGFAEYFRHDALCVIEWPEKLGDRLPPVDIALTLSWVSEMGETRRAQLIARTAMGSACLNMIAHLS
ncbi:MAG: tRNA (adenosine(37)-N6)-threonylcarbamoyltransferase complex ATPase subunit type 1 TsaE [Burkholderiales bacterium]|nr:tRNA (adenosine(37)-N6)-threonylcarbamoyltransferase complex ATPase subunit type 1 TsaE [Burkholderiales bacterium]